MTDDPRFRDRGVYLPGADALVVADLHVGRDATSNVELPMGERSDLLDRLEGLLDAFDPAEVVLAGDVVHAFDRVPDGVGRTVEAVLDAIEGVGADPVVLRGNHDPMLETLARVDDLEHRLDDGTVVCHGHETPDADADRYVVGHDHPAIEIEGRRRPCFLVGQGVYRGADVVMVPSFTRLAPGTTVNGASGRDLRSPLVETLDPFRPVVRDEEADETLRFPPLGEFRRLL